MTAKNRSTRSLVQLYRHCLDLCNETIMMLAGVDIGTLTCRLLIAEVGSDGQLTEKRSDRRILQLGKGVDRDRTLQPTAMARVIAVLKEWRHLIETLTVDGETAVATSAVRDAGNQTEFLAKVKESSGFEVEVLSGEEEARRTLLGIRSGLPKSIREVLALDIGGGSTEFILDRPPCLPIVTSLDLGVVRLSERLFKHDPPTTEEVESARTLIRIQMRKIQPLLSDTCKVTFTGTAGTITTLAAMAQCLRTYESASVHHYRLKLTTILELEKSILLQTRSARRAWPGLETGREEVIAAGVIILSTVMTTLGITECLVSDRGLREGVLLTLARRLIGR